MVVVWVRTTITVFMRAAMVSDTRAATRSAMGSRDNVNRNNWVDMKRPMAPVEVRTGGIGLACAAALRFFSQSL
ncbi:hypothetical protein G6F65_022123 [Rhizopus arrhizus]|nr:hypothetical protein G6F65_022123 [Rhizopus arrhizus]